MEIGATETLITACHPFCHTVVCRVADGRFAYVTKPKTIFDTDLCHVHCGSVILPFEILFHFLLLEFSSLTDTCARISLLIKGAYKKEARVSELLLIPNSEALALPIFQRQAMPKPTLNRIYNRVKYMRTHGRWPLLYHVEDFEFARF